MNGTCYLAPIAFVALLGSPAAGQDWLQYVSDFGQADEHVRAMDVDPRAGASELAVVLASPLTNASSDDRIAFFGLDQDGLLERIGRVTPSGLPLSTAGRNGLHISHGGDRIAVGARDAGNHGRVYIFDRTPSGWLEDTVLIGVPALGDLGFDDPQLDGDRLMVVQSDPAASMSHVHTFRDSPSGWQLEGTITLPCGTAGCGWTAALQGDRLVVARAWHVNPSQTPDPVAIYSWSGTAWQLEGRLEPPAGAWFGGPVALEGNRLFFTEYEPRIASGWPAFVHVLEWTPNGLRRIQRIDHRPAGAFVGLGLPAITEFGARGRQLLITSGQYAVTTRYEWTGTEYAPVVGYRTSGGFGFGGPGRWVAFLGERITAGYFGIYLFDELPIGRATYGCFADPSLGFIGCGPSTSLSRGDLRILVPNLWNPVAGATLLMGFESVHPVAGTSPLCIGGSLLRLGPGTLGNNNGSRYWRIAAFPFFGALTPGTTAYFQYWSPDPGGAPGGRATHSIALTFAP